MTRGPGNTIDGRIGDGNARPDRASDPGTGPFTLPVLCWCLIQVAALCVAALRIPLAAKYPQPPELLAVHMIAGTQVAASALLFPYLLGDWRTSLAVIAAACPFAALATVLSALPVDRVAIAEAYVTAWLVGLALWRVVLRGSRASLYGAGISTALVIGGASAWYLDLEFGSGNPQVEQSGKSIWSFGPLTSVLRQVTSGQTQLSDWLLPVANISSALTVLLVRRVGGYDRLSTTPAPAASSDRLIGR